MPETNDRVEMSLDQVIKKDWQGPPGSKEGRGEGRPVGKVAAFGKAVLGKGRGRGKGGKGGKSGKGGSGRGLVRRNPIMTKVRRAPTKGASKSKGKGKIRETRDDWEKGGKGKGRREGGKSGGKGKSSGKSTGKSRGKSVVQGLRLWRGAAARSGTTNAETRAGKGGKSKGKGKSPGKSLRSSNILRVNRNPTFLKRSSKGQGKKGGGKALAVSNYNGKGQSSYGKGKTKGKSYNDNGRRGYGGGGNSSNYSGNSYGGAYSGGGSWGQERSQDWGYDNYSKGGKGSRETSPRASDQLSVEDKRMMKKITVVAQLDKVPKPHPAMQGLRKRSTGGDTGALSSRFAANFRR